MGAHVKEPWHVVSRHREGYVGILGINEDRGPLSSYGGEHLSVVMEMDDPDSARRIVACVNACAGIPTEALEAGALAAAFDSVGELIRALRREPA